MSTQCGVAIKTEKGYETIYVHSDGYPEYMWPMLTENYNSEAWARKLVDAGDASFIDERFEPTPGVAHTFDFPERGVCIFYHRDRGEDFRNVCYPIKKEMFSCYYYSYIWEDGCWKFYKGGKKIY